MGSRHLTIAWRLVTPLVALALVASGLLVAQAANGPARVKPADLEYYINYAAPQADRQSTGKETKKNGVFRPKGYRSALEQALTVDAKFGGGYPRTARQLAKLEAKAIRQNTSPRQIKQAKGTQHAQAPDDPRRVQRRSERRLHGRHGPGDRLREPGVRAGQRPERTRCTTTSRTRPTFAHPDNNTLLGGGLLAEHFNKMLYTEDRHHRARPPGPDRSRRRARASTSPATR